MKDRLFGPSALFAATFVFVLTTGATDVPTKASFGFVAPVPEQPLMQPVLDRFGADVERGLAAIAPIAFAAVKGDAVNLATCRDRHLVGFVEPHRRWRITDQTVSTETTLTVFDCYGYMFYRGHTMRAEQRDPDAEPQAQIDRTQSEATDALMQDFARFIQAHQADWERILRSGSIGGSR
jgi:hypothetical protein